MIETLNFIALKGAKLGQVAACLLSNIVFLGLRKVRPSFLKSDAIDSLYNP
jgi:hypothetical protein